jgi:hypothetical protein
MARQCSICAHEKCESITLDILRGLPLRQVAVKYGLSTSAVHRHKGHISTTLTKYDDAKQVAEPGSIMKRIMELDSRADLIYREAIAAKDRNTALKALKELRELTTVYAKLAGEIQTQTIHQHLHISPEWLSLRQQMLNALAPFPEARDTLIKAIGGA